MRCVEFATESQARDYKASLKNDATAGDPTPHGGKWILCYEYTNPTGSPSAFAPADGLSDMGNEPVAEATAAASEGSDDEAVIPPFSVAKVRPLFPGARLESLRGNLPLILHALRASGLEAPKMIVYALATIRAENSGFLPLEERQSKWNTEPGGPPFGKYDKNKRLGNREPGDGARFRGRGFIQLTGRYNYDDIGEKVGLDLINNPDLASEATNAAGIFAAYLKSRQRRIETALASNDLQEARAAVNGGDHGMQNFCAAFDAGIRLLQEASAYA